MSNRWTAPAPMLARVAQRLRRALAPPSRAYLALRGQGETAGWGTPGRRGKPAGWVTPERARRLAGWPDYFLVGADAVDCAPSLATAAARTAALAEVAHTLAAEGALTAWRDERYAVATRPGGTILFEIER